MAKQLPFSSTTQQSKPLTKTQPITAGQVKGILYDARYQQTVKKDHTRQRIRRTSHKIMRALEHANKLTKWKKAPAKKQTLSTCIITMNSADRIAPLLRYIRSFSDEIVVGVDSKTTDNTFAVCEPLADVVFTIDNEAQTCNGGLQALVEKCTSDWVLRLDDDEFPEPLFEELLQGLMADKYTHYKFPRLHLCQTEPLKWINDGYLYPDFQMRLFKNQPELLTFPDAVGHTSIECAGKRGKVNSVNLVHLNFAINPRHKREEKLLRYIDRLNGEWVHPINEYALLLEDFNYRIDAYECDADFAKALVNTIEHQRSIYLKNK